MGIRCGELLALPALKDIRVAGGETGLNRIVDWVYFGDVIDDLEDGVNWVNGNEIVIITGASIHGEYNRLLKMLPEYDRRGIAGILISFGRYLSDIPTEIVEESNRLSLPIFMLPWEVKLVDATRDICNAIIANEIAEHESANILDALLFGTLGLHEHLPLLLSRAGFSLDHSYRVCVIDVINTETYADMDRPLSRNGLWTSLLSVVRSIFAYYSPKVFYTWRENTIIILLSCKSHTRISHAIEHITSSMRELWPLLEIKAGIGHSYRQPEKLPLSYQQARQAIQEALIDEAMPSTVFYTEGDIYSLLFGLRQQELLQIYRDTVLGPLFKYEKNNGLGLFETLECYFEHGMSVTEAAVALCIHKNTMKYRLAKIQEILSVDLKETSVISTIYIAIKAHKMLSSEQQEELLS